MSREALTFPASRDAPGQGTTAGGGRVQASYREKEQASSGHSPTVTLPLPSLAGAYLQRPLSSLPPIVEAELLPPGALPWGVKASRVGNCWALCLGHAKGGQPWMPGTRTRTACQPLMSSSAGLPVINLLLTGSLLVPSFLLPSVSRWLMGQDLGLRY